MFYNEQGLNALQVKSTDGNPTLWGSARDSKRESVDFDASGRLIGIYGTYTGESITSIGFYSVNATCM